MDPATSAAMSSSGSYRRPPLLRGFEPKRVNWLWRLICEAAQIDAEAVHRALIASDVPVSLSRVQSWLAHEDDDDYFPMSIAELERNLRALIAVRHLR